MLAVRSKCSHAISVISVLLAVAGSVALRTHNGKAPAPSLSKHLTE